MPSNFLVASAQTWESDSHGLFDYESKALYRKTFKAPLNGNDYKLVRTGNDVGLVQSDSVLSDNQRTLSRVVCDKGSYKIATAGDSKDGDRLWLVLKTLKGTSVLNVGDLVKLGRFRLKVKEIVLNHQQHQDALSSQRPVRPIPINGDDDTETVAPDENLEVECSHESDVGLCRVCLSEGSEHGNPLVAPCLCRGSMRYVHLQCLRRWMEGRLNIRADGNQSSFFWRALDCELCKTPYPIFVDAFNKQVELFEVPRPEWPYIILETVMKPSDSPLRGLHILSFANKKSMKLGRGHESDIRITDISVSRCHARIEIQKNGFIIKDDNSKFGTLIGWKYPYNLDPGGSVSFQVGRTVVELSHSKRCFSLLPSCISKSSKNIDEVVTIHSSTPESSSTARRRSARPSSVDVIEEPAIPQVVSIHIDDIVERLPYNEHRQVSQDSQLAGGNSPAA
eukprot:GHVL01023214.1.p1 GENE.GHVL01023214.1~~GHVL01023214.1.p1  ORF type:complete len:451 (+),score=70.63 GHVL01023214.1:152-1504(+)